MRSWLHVDIVMAALSRGAELALRDWRLLRTAENGQGHCREPEFRAHLARLGYRRTAIADAKKRLIATGMATVQSPIRGGPPVWRPLSLTGMIDRFGLGRIRRHLQVPLADLKRKALPQRLFALVEAGLGNTPKARGTLEAMTVVPKTTQIRAEKRIGAVVSVNHVRASLDAVAAMPGVAEGRPGRRTVSDESSPYVQTVNSVA